METLFAFTIFAEFPPLFLLIFSPPGRRIRNNLMANRVGVDMPSANLSSTFSRLIPLSRSPTAQLTTQLRYRETPAEYRPTSTNQSCDTLDQQRTTALGDEMRAVQSTYTARVRDQNLSSTVQDLCRLVTTLAAEAIPESDEHLGSSIEKASVVRTIDRFVRETTSEYGTALRELSSRTHDTRLFRFHAHLADYAGALCKLLKDSKQFSSSHTLSRPWIEIVEAIDKCQDLVTSWNASGCKGPEPSCPEMDLLEVRVQQLIKEGYTILDRDLALFAIRSYARRNFVSHGEIFALHQSKEFAGLANYIENDEKLLEDVLPDEEKPMVGNWRRLLKFYRDLHIRQTSDGVWEGQTSLSVRALSPLPLDDKSRLAQAVMRSEIEMGRKRESNSPDGPPPQNVKFDPGSLRRRSDPGRRSTKRCAMGQPPGHTSPKKARGMFYTPDLEDVEEPIKDQDAWGVEMLQFKLYTLGAKLASASPSGACKVFQPQMEQLEGELARVKGKIEKRRNQRAKKSWSKGQKE